MTGDSGAEPVEIFEWLDSEFKKKYGCDKFEDDKVISIINNNIKLVFPEERLSSYFSRPFSHLPKKDEVNPSLFIKCFKVDGEFMSLVMKIFPGIIDGERRDIPFLSRNGIVVSYGRESNTLSILNKNSGVALFIFDEIENLPYYEAGSPFKSILQWWFDSHDTAMLHSASVCHEKCGYLISGRGGSGKSTTALSCVKNGMSYLGDDYIVVSLREDISVSSIYNSIKLTRGSIGKFPELDESLINPGFGNKEKGVAFLNNIGNGYVIGSAHLKGIILPEICDREDSSISKVSSSEGFRSLAPSTIFQHIGRRRNISELIVKLTKILPCYRLKAGRDPEMVSKAIKSISESN